MYSDMKGSSLLIIIMGEAVDGFTFLSEPNVLRCEAFVFQSRMAESPCRTCFRVACNFSTRIEITFSGQKEWIHIRSHDTP